MLDTSPASRLSSLNLFICTVVMQKNTLVFKKKGKKEDAERWAPESLESCLKPPPLSLPPSSPLNQGSPKMEQ